MRTFFFALLPLIALTAACPQTNTCQSDQDCVAPLPTCDTACGTCIDPCAVDGDCKAPQICGPSACGTGQAACQAPSSGGAGGEAGQGGAGGEGGAGGTGGSTRGAP